MTTRRLSLRKMENADVKFVSLVGRSANRIPFRVIKSDKENGMGINLSLLGRVLKGGEAQKPVLPEIVAIVVEKNDKLEAITDAIRDSGLDVSNVVENEDQTVSFVQKQTDEGDELSIVRMDDNVVVVMKGFRPYCDELKDFSDIVKAQGFYQGLDAATAAFRDTVQKALWDADNPAEVAKKVDETVTSFGQYVRGLATALPLKAFHVTKSVALAVENEELVSKGAKAPKKAPTGMDQAEWDAMDEAKKMGHMKEKAKKDENVATDTTTEDDVDLSVVPDTVSKKDWMAMSDEQKRGHLKEVAKSDVKPEASVDFASLIQKGLADGFATLNARVDELAAGVKAIEDIKKAQEDLAGRLDSVVQKADSVTSVVKTTVVNAVAKSDTPSGTVEKSDVQSDPRVGAFDTAMIRKSQRLDRSSR